MISAALILGGRSVRMGWDKSQLLLQGQPLWEYQLDRLRAMRPARLLVSARGDQVLPATLSPDVHVIRDRYVEAGPLGGLASCLHHLELDGPGQRLVVLAIDMPFMSPAYLQDLVFESAPGRGLVPKVQGFWDPLAAVYPVEAAPVARQLIARQQFTLQAFCQELLRLRLIEEVPLRDYPPEMFDNINTPEEAISLGLRFPSGLA